MRDGGQARPVEDHDGGEPGAHGGHLGGVARRHRRHQAGREALKDLRKEGRPQIATALKECFGARLDPGERRIPPLQRVDQGLTQRLRGPQHHRRPEADQGFEGPHPLPLGLPHRAEDRAAQCWRDVLLQQIDNPQQIDRLRALGHSPSWRWGCYDSVNATSGDLPSNYLSGDESKASKADSTRPSHRTSSSVRSSPTSSRTEHRTITGHLPGVVLEPTRQVQLTCPRLLASWGTRPRARDGPDLYSTTIVQAAPGTVLAVSVASVNGATGVVRLTSSTETSIAPAAEKQRSMTTTAIAALISFTRGPAGREGSRSPHTACPARARARQAA